MGEIRHSSHHLHNQKMKLKIHFMCAMVVQKRIMILKGILLLLLPIQVSVMQVIHQMVVQMERDSGCSKALGREDDRECLYL